VPGKAVLATHNNLCNSHGRVLSLQGQYANAMAANERLQAQLDQELQLHAATRRQADEERARLQAAVQVRARPTARRAGLFLARLSLLQWSVEGVG
jgi:hypothetical protein